MFTRNNKLYAIGGGNTEILETLPPKVFSVVQTLFGYALEEMFDKFEMPPKLYGSTAKNATRVLTTYRDRNRSTGVLMIGEKGSGKSLLAKHISNESGLPVIMINTAESDEEFFKFLRDIKQPCVVLVDEFEKVYKHDKDNNQSSQEPLLTLLDGTLTSNKLFLLTANDRTAVNEFMFNRPGRIYYQFIFDGLEEQFIKDYLEDHGMSRQRITEVVDFCAMFWSFNFDMLQALVEEMNRYGESPFEAAKTLNINMEGTQMSYSATVYRDGKKVHTEDNFTRAYPLSVAQMHLQFQDEGLKDDEGDPCWVSLAFTPAERMLRQRADHEIEGQFVFKIKETVESHDVTYLIVLKKATRDTRFWGAF
jgi:hypothetical protein